MCAHKGRKYECAGKGEYEVCASNGWKKGKEKTDEGSSVLLYFMTEEGKRE